MISAKTSGFRLAPPTSPPSIISFAMNSAILSGVTLPPYSMRTASAVPSPAIDANSRLISEIAAASKEQSSGIAQINDGVAQMDTLTQQNAANSEESAAAAEELNAQAESLAAMIGSFRIRQTANTQMVAQPMRLSRTPSRISTPPPERGEHTDEILAGLGLGRDEIQDLRQRNVI